jgi:hypothetical protein
MSLTEVCRLTAITLVLLVAVASCNSASAAPAEDGAKLSLIPPLMGVHAEPRVAPPGTPRKIVVAGTWPNGCVPTAAVLGPPQSQPKPTLGVLLIEPQTLVACTTALTPYRLEVDYTPQAAGQLEIHVMTNQAKALGRGTLVTGDAADPRAIYDVAGAFFDPQTSGSGVMIAHDYGRSDVLFGTWQIYEAGTGSPRWFSLQSGRWSADGLAWEGTLYETKAGPTPCPLCPMPAELVIDRGRVRLAFSVNGANGGLDAAFDFLPASGPPQRISNLRRFLPDRLVILE